MNAQGKDIATLVALILASAVVAILALVGVGALILWGVLA